MYVSKDDGISSPRSLSWFSVKNQEKVEKLKYKKLKVMQPRIKKIRTFSCYIYHPGSVHKKF